MKTTLLFLAITLLSPNLFAAQQDKPIALSEDLYGGSIPDEGLYEEEVIEVKDDFTPDQIKDNDVIAPAKPYDRFVDVPSTGPGSNTFEDNTPSPETVKPVQPLPIAHQAPFQNSSLSSRAQLEENVKLCTEEINGLYSRQKGVPRSKKQQFQCRIGDAQEGCDRMKQELEKIKNAEETIKTSELKAHKAMEQYSQNIQQAKRSNES